MMQGSSWLDELVVVVVGYYNVYVTQTYIGYQSNSE